MIETSLGALAAAFRARTDDPVHALDRAEAAAQRAGVAGGIRCVLPQARAAAEASVARFARGQPLSAIDGIPVAVKDCIDVAGEASFAGTRFLREPAKADATAVQRLRAAGAVVFAKAEMHELGIQPTGINPVRGTPVNPWAHDRIPGGSSSGSAVAVATGIAAAALGTDAGGSIRVPAALCGLVGLKPTFESIPLDGVTQLTHDLDHLGPIAWTVADVAVLFEALAQRTLDPRAQVRRVGVLTDFFAHTEQPVQDAVRAALRQSFVDPEDVATPACAWAFQVQIVLTGIQAVDRLRPLRERHERQLGRDTRALLRLAERLPPEDRARAERARAAMRSELGELLSSYDVLLAPAVGCLAPPLSPSAARSGELDLTTMGQLAAVTFPANLTGFPSCVVPCVRSGPPIALQILGRPGGEATVLAAARAVEAMFGPRRPPRWLA